jgi:bisphosphoglycerate-dependent phosphoglycerate mutase
MKLAQIYFGRSTADHITAQQSSRDAGAQCKREQADMAQKQRLIERIYGALQAHRSPYRSV